MKLLHIDSSITGENSVSRQLTSQIVVRLRTFVPDAKVIYRDLANDPLAHIELASLPGDTSAEAKASASILDEFLSADTIVIGAPMYNFTIPSQLKAWLDRFLIAGKTFRYTENGPEGLASGKRVIIAVSRGGFYSEDSPAADMEHVQSYLAHVFNFIGIEPEFVVAEGIAVGPDQRAAALDVAGGMITALAA